MDAPQPYILVCSPSGSGLTAAVAKLTAAIPQLHEENVETRLCEQRSTREALRRIGCDPPRGVADWPTMYDVTWYLPGAHVTDLWSEAVQQALQRLWLNPSGMKILSCRLTYYSGKRDQFYSPINARLFTDRTLKPSRIFVLIDDVYDTYLRLNTDHQLYTSIDRIDGFFARIADEHSLDPRLLAAEDHTGLLLDLEIDTLLHLLQWRHQEILCALSLARQLRLPIMIFGVKQLIRVASAWLGSRTPRSVYISHPISRPRRLYREQHSWHSAVTECNQLPALLLEHDLVCITPSAIDEYRIRRQARAPQAQPSLSVRVPLLDDRWPLHGGGDEVLYSPPTSAKDNHHTELLALKTWDFDKHTLSTFVPAKKQSPALTAKIDTLLATLGRQLESEIASRDHWFVTLCPYLLVYRPLLLSADYSGGVKAEIDHWRALAIAEPARRMVFIHFDEDVTALINEYKSSSDLRDFMTDEIREQLVSRVKDEHGLDGGGVEAAFSYIQSGGPIDVLDRGGVPPAVASQIQSRLSNHVIFATSSWLYQKLSGYHIGSRHVREQQIAVTVIPDSEQLAGEIPSICGFIKDGTVLPRVWEERFFASIGIGREDLLPKHRARW